MFKNKNWFKVLVPQVVAVVVIMAVFFGCRWLGMDDKNAAAVAVAVAIAAVAAITAAAAATITAAVAEEYKLPWYWVAISYLTEEAMIFLPLYITIS
ncbi:hypothetical protein HY250_01240 [Candidatus Azambacteria bacterium]|nr:hypothetical protein [Candidatus Azambacteria bacterium]